MEPAALEKAPSGNVLRSALALGLNDKMQRKLSYHEVLNSMTDLDTNSKAVLQDLWNLGHKDLDENLKHLQNTEKGDAKKTLDRIVQIYKYHSELNSLPEGN